MAAGKPVVAAANDGYNSVISGKGRDLLFPPRDNHALAELLRNLIVNNELREEHGIFNRNEVSWFDMETVCARILEVYHNAINGKEKRNKIFILLHNDNCKMTSLKSDNEMQ